MGKIQVSVGKQGRCLYELKMVVSRKPAFYVYNVMLMVGGISTLAFFAFLFKAEDWDKRSNYIGMLLLTTSRSSSSWRTRCPRYLSSRLWMFISSPRSSCC